MLRHLSQWIEDYHLQHLFKQGSFGIEKEGLRTTFFGDLALSDHPKTLGSRAHHPYLQTDFSESQPELVTPACDSLAHAFNWLYALHDVLNQSMSEDEFLWPFSMPNRLPEEQDIPIIRVEDQSAIDYRKRLAETYGKKLQMISGIHYNFSLTDDFIQALHKVSGTADDYITFNNELYIKLASNFLRYEWILTYLYGAAPYAESDFYQREKGDLPQPENYLRSLRKSEYGYHNDNEVVVRLDSVATYVNDLEHFVDEGILSEEREFYGNARLRGKGKHVRQMLSSGVEYIEFRSFDLNPYAEVGISEGQAAFIHLFLMTMLWLEEKATTEDIQLGQKRNIAVANENPLAPTAFIAEGQRILEVMAEVATSISAEDIYQRELTWAQEAFLNPQKTIAAQIVNDLKDTNFIDLGCRLGQIYKKRATETPYRLRGFADFELSTQLLIFDALQLGVEVEVLDASDQFIQLSFADHIEYVRNGNMTSHDTTISHFIMENKIVTKHILEQAGYRVPKGFHFSSIQEASEAYLYLQGKPVVIKPKSTNYGWGISILKENFTQKAYEEALAIAFSYDDQVLVEEYIAGSEYRFFVLNGKTEAVLKRIPAHVIGDGQQTIGELIDQKNEDPLRGDHHQTPLGRLGKGSEEKLMLAEQGLDFDSVVEAGQVVYLRENSNISTGGDSVDMTDTMHESYQRIAEGICQALGVNVSGVDLIVPDYTAVATSDNYSCLEANFNPAMNMHAFVTKGKGRRLTRQILAMLFPEAMSDQYWQDRQ